jgi:membrane-bound inhibitor of C-type lysozyme
MLYYRRVIGKKKIWMQAPVAIVLLAAVIAAGAGSCTGIKTRSLTVRGGDPVVYRCDNGEQIVARYYSLSDDSLRFVKVVMPDRREHTLPNALSASGARYTDDVDMVWWTKGDSAFVQGRNQNGDWQITHQNCREMLQK